MFKCTLSTFFVIFKLFYESIAWCIHLIVLDFLKNSYDYLLIIPNIFYLSMYNIMSNIKYLVVPII